MGQRQPGALPTAAHFSAAALMLMLFAAGCGSSSKSTTAPPPSSAGSISSSTAAGAATTLAPPSTTAPASPGLDSCSVITQAEAGDALGQSVRAPVRGKATVEGGVACVFYGPSVPAGADPDVPVTDSVRVVLVGGPNAPSFFNDYRSKVPAQAIAGYGDQAYYDGSASFSVLKGAEYLRIAVIGVPHVLAAEEKLASDALPLM